MLHVKKINQCKLYECYWGEKNSVTPNKLIDSKSDSNCVFVATLLNTV